MVENTGNIDALLQEDRRFPPPEGFAKHANIRDAAVYEEPEGPRGFLGWIR